MGNPFKSNVPKPPKPPALPPPPPPLPTAAEEPVQQAESDARRRARAQGARSILTSASGLTEAASTAKKTLLGA